MQSLCKEAVLGDSRANNGGKKKEKKGKTEPEGRRGVSLFFRRTNDGA